VVTRLFLLFAVETTDAIWLEGPRIYNEFLGTRIDGYDSGGRKWEKFDVDYWKGQFWWLPVSLTLSTRLGFTIAANWVAFVQEQV
jgi:hypothetical protein